MTIDHTQDGLLLRIRPEGAGRFGGAAFLTVWLCFWAVGEVTVLGVLGSGAYALLTGNPKAPALGGAFGVGAFLLVWVTFWTFGGIAAILELLRLISSEETLTIGNEILLKRRRGPFTWTERIARQDVRNVRVAPRRRMLVLETPRKSIEFAAVPSPKDEQEALAALRQSLQLAGPTGEASLPDGWEEILTPEGDRVVVRNTKTRKKQALVLYTAAAIAWGLALLFAWYGNVGPAIAVTAAAAAAGGWAWWLDQGRQEIKLGSGRLTVRRRWRGRVRDLYEASRLELELSTDSDGDVWYKLEAISNAPLNARGTRGKRTRQLASAMNDPFEPRALGAYLAKRADVPYDALDP